MNHKLLFALAATALLSGPGLLAQTPAAASATDDTVVLDPFVVSGAGAYNGYTATQSSTGTRVASDIKATPFAIDVTPLEIWNDFGLMTFNQQETLSTVPGVSPTESNGTYNIRGISNGGFFLRDGFLRFGRIDQSNVERIEVIKGPAGAIYGKTLPGGIINAISKEVTWKPEYNLDTQRGGLEQYRIGASASGPIVSKKLAYRVDLARSHEAAFENDRVNWLKSYSGQLKWQVGKDTSITASVDYNDEFRGGRDGLDEAVIRTSANAGTYLGLGWDFMKVNPLGSTLYDPKLNTSGAVSFSRFLSKDMNLSLVHRFNNMFSLRFGSNRHSFDLTTLRGRGNWDPTTNKVFNRRPDYGFENRHGHAFNLDLLSEFKTGPIKHSLLTTFDFVRDQRELGPTSRLNTSVYSIANGYPAAGYLKEFNASTGDTNPYPDLGSFTALYRDQNAINTTKGMLINDRITLLNDRLILSLGGRIDQVHQVADDYFAHSATSDTNVSAKTVKWGLNYNITKAITFFSSYSTCFSPQTVLDPTGNPFPNQTGAGYDTGVKFDLFEKQLFVTINYFDITYSNIVVQQLNPVTSVTEFTLNGKTKSKGAELSIGGMLWKKLTIKAGAGYTDAWYVDQSTANAALIGLQPRSVPTWTMGGVIKYDFESKIYVGTNVTYNSSSRYTDSLTGNRYRTRVPGYVRWDFMSGYKFKTNNDRFQHDVGVGVKNAFDLLYATSNDPTQGNPRQYYAKYTLKFR